MAGEKYDDVNIPLDLMVEILKILPAKSLMRFLCVSKPWTSIIREFIVIDSTVTRSLTESSRDPHFIFRTNSRSGKTFWYAYQNKSKLCHGKVLETSEGIRCQYVRGLIGFWSLRYGRFTVHNPITSQSISLPDLSLTEVRFFLFGYNPLENQYKVVCDTQSYSTPFRVYTLGDPTKQWRNIQCSIGTHFTFTTSVCINGTIYYKALIKESRTRFMASFDVRSEKFDHLQAPEELTAHFSGYTTLVNYQGKLGCIRVNKHDKDVDLWVMEDSKKQEWSKITFLSMLQGLPRCISFSGVTNHVGEIVMVPSKCRDDPILLEVHYYDPKQNSRRSIEIETTMPMDLARIWVVTDHVENTMWF